MSTMTDRESLELAAKAAGYEVEIDHNGVIHNHEGSGPQSWAVWNPLTDDGDAFRLLVDLRMLVDVPSEPEIDRKSIDVIAPRLRVDIKEPLQKDMRAATRRAIVRAAAEIGKGMP